MPIGPRRLSLLTFPQSWDGISLVVRFLCLPKGSPLDPLNPGLSSFAAANLVFEAHLIGSLEHLPHPSDALSTGVLTLDEAPTRKAGLFAELANEFNIVPRGPARPQASFRKAMTESYRALIGNRQHSNLLADADEFECALHQGATDQPDDPVPPDNSVTWGRLLAFALRQPRLAAELGLAGQVTITPADPAFFASGGWLYLDLHESSDFAGADITARYGARIPRLVEPKPIFAAILFPVTDVPSDFIFDDLAREAELYEDGLAKLVHGAQTQSSGDAIQLAWDDEQIAEWLHRQVQTTPDGSDLLTDAPLGVAGYRVDVRLAGEPSWNSLVKIESVADLQLGDFNLGSFQGESIVEVAPAQISPKQPGRFWLPSYFTTWRGSSLVLTDADLTRMHARPDVQNPEAKSHLLDREKFFTPVDDKLVPLTYGNTYEFRVRLSDLTRGGPGIDVTMPEPARTSIVSLPFRRRKAPGQVLVLQRPTAEVRQIIIAKPLLGYPEVLFTGAATFADLEGDLDTLSADRTITREIGLPDPDVLTVTIEVQVKALDGDTASFLPLYTTTRVFDAPELTLDLEFQDHPTLDTLAEVQPDAGPLAIPTARSMRLVLTALGRDKADYFVDEESRRGAPVTVDFRAQASVEADLFVEAEALSALRSFFFQPPPPDNSVASPAERLAAEMDLDHAALTLSGRTGKRTVVACSSALRHTLSPESSSITFASASDFVQRWVNVVKFEVARDWTWDGLALAGITVTRTIQFSGSDDVLIEVAGNFRLPRAIGSKARAGIPIDARDPARQFTDLIFFDAFDPKPKQIPGAAQVFPAEITVTYSLQPVYEGPPAVDPVLRSTLLPITTPPSQVPQILSAGIALSEFKAADDYSSTQARERVLWLEFAAPPADLQDAYFVRVLARGPDPMLLEPRTLLPEVPETPIPLDPEWMRLITPGQPRDDNGLSAMQTVGGAQPDTARYLIPIPPDLNPASTDLFGFFVYEVRIGHTDARWSTAQGRYGPMLRVAGVQHPAPSLVCQAARVKGDVLVKAPYASPSLNGANLRPQIPRTDLWAVLYARIRQADGAAWRNVVLAQTQLVAPRLGNDPERAGVPILYAEGVFPAATVTAGLAQLGLPDDEPLTVLTAELFGDPGEPDPLSSRIGQARLLRISSLISVPDAC